MENNTLLLLNDIPIFNRLRIDELKVVSKHMQPFSFEAGQVVFKEGEHANAVCFVIKGQLDVFKEKQPGKPLKIATLRSGQSIGEMAIIDGLTRSATVKAVTGTQVMVLKRSDFSQLLESHPKIGQTILMGIARLLSLNLRKTSDEVTSLMLGIA